MRAVWLGAAIVLLTLAVFAPVLHHDFLEYDDDVYVTANPNLREGPTPAAIWQALREPYEANWIPLTWISFQLDFALYGDEPRGYHATNVFLHAAAALLLFLALRRMTGEDLPAAFAAALFAVHPLHVESVAWISERKDTLSGLAFAATLLAYARYVEVPSLARYLGVFGAFGLGLLAKPMGVTLPFVLWLLDFWPLRRITLRGLRPVADGRVGWEKVPLLLAALGVSAIAWSAQQRSGAMAHGDAFPVGVRLANAALSYLAYLRDALWPSQLSIFYPHPGRDVSFAAAGAAGLALAALTIAAIRVAKRRPHLTVGWLWFVGMLVPVIGLVQVGMQARADRYTYLPLIGLAIAAAWTLRDVATSPARRRLVGIGGLAALVALAATARLQTAPWRDTEALFRHAAAVTEDNFLAHHWIGSVLLRRDALDEAEPHFREALRIAPDWPDAQTGLADVYAGRRDWPQAIRAYDRAVRLAPRDARAQLRLARALAAAGQEAEALGRARHAVRLAEGPVLAEAQIILGSILAQRGDLPAAIAAFDAAIAVDPGLPAAQLARAIALLEAGHLAEGDRALASAEQLGIAPSALAEALAELERRIDDRGESELASALRERRGRYEARARP